MLGFKCEWKERDLPKLIVAIKLVKIVGAVTVVKALAKTLDLFSRDAAPTGFHQLRASLENGTRERPGPSSYQCFQAQLPCSFISTQLPKRSSPFMTLTFSCLHRVSLQPARLLGETSVRLVSFNDMEKGWTIRDGEGIDTARRFLRMRSGRV